MKSKNVLEEFEAYLRRGGHGGIPESPVAGFSRMLAFYGDVRVDDASPEAYSDALLFQWGSYDWGHGPQFEVDLTRQVIRGSGEDDEIWQLHMTYRFAPSEALRNLGSGDRWCPLP